VNESDDVFDEMPDGWEPDTEDFRRMRIESYRYSSSPRMTSAEMAGAVGLKAVGTGIRCSCGSVVATWAITSGREFKFIWRESDGRIEQVAAWRASRLPRAVFEADAWCGQHAVMLWNLRLRRPQL
jgi:hypothetical protein